MNSPLARGTRALEELVPGALRPLVRRVEAHWEDGLVWTLETPKGLRWFHTRDHSVEELWLVNDLRLPVAEALSQRSPEPVNILSWRPGRRVVVSVGTGMQRTIIKGYRHGRSARAERTHLNAAAACASTPFRVAPLIERDAKLETLVFEPLEGVPLTFDTANADCFFRIGDGLRHLHRDRPMSSLPTHDRNDELRVLDRLAASVARYDALPSGLVSTRARLGDAIA